MNAEHNTTITLKFRGELIQERRCFRCDVNKFIKRCERQYGQGWKIFAKHIEVIILEDETTASGLPRPKPKVSLPTEKLMIKGHHGLGPKNFQKYY